MNRRSRRRATRKQGPTKVPWWVLVLLGMAALLVAVGRILKWY